MSKKVVMCVGTWPEDNYKDFVVREVKDYETDEEAIECARASYGNDQEYYIDFWKGDYLYSR